MLFAIGARIDKIRQWHRDGKKIRSIAYAKSVGAMCQMVMGTVVIGVWS